MVIAQSGLPSSYNGYTAAAWKGSKFPGNTSATRFPTVGLPAPGSPDVSATVAAGAYSLSTPTNETYHVAIYDGSNKVVFHFLQNYQAPSYSAPIVICGQGNPNTLLVPAPANAIFWDVSATDPGAALRMFVSRNGAWVATAA